MEPIKETMAKPKATNGNRVHELQEKLEQMKDLLEAERKRYNDISIRLESAKEEIGDLTMTIRLLTRDRVMLQRRVNG
jgi:archaellum component FlaC